MESQRNLLLIALLVVSYLLFEQWQVDNAPAAPQTTTVESSKQTSKDSVSEDFIPESSDNTKPSSIVKAVNTANLIEVKTDVLTIKINTQGGDIVEAQLLKYDTELDNGIPIKLLQNGQFKHIAQSGLTGVNGLDRVIKGRPIYQSAEKNYQFSNDQQTLVVDLIYIDNQALSVTKRFTFSRDGYDIKVDYIIKNNMPTNASVQLYAQLKQTVNIPKSSSMMPTSAYRGAAYSTSEDLYEKYDFDDIKDQPLNMVTKGGWVAMIQHYFVSAWVPQQDSENQLYSSYTSNGDAVIGFKAPTLIIEPNAEKTASATLYIGPKDQDEMAKLAPGLDLTIDYGFLWMISQPLFWLLVQIHSLVGNWGIAIIVITLIVKGGMYPLTKVQYTSMAKMRELQPKIAALKERFGDDRQKMSKAMMDMYKKEKVNPAGGCLPLLLQMPIFLALYWVFLESVELRHAPFMLWIQDLSAKDPYYILPILMGISMYVMQKMQPMTIQDPMQQKMMQYMPVFFTIFFFWFPSGLVLYWLVSNIISIVQMKIIFAGIEKKKKAKE